MKKRLAKASALVITLSMLTPMAAFANGTKGTYDNGTYRGTYEDDGGQQVSIQFKIENNTLNSLSFRHLTYKDTNFLQLKEGQEKYPVLLQNQQALKHLEGKPVEAMYDLYTPGNFVGDIDGFSGATIRGSKILSAIQDGLNRGVYVPSGEFSKTLGNYEDGRYRGVFSDGGIQQVGIQFDLQNNIIKNLSFRHLYYGGVDYRQLKEGNDGYPVLLQNKQILSYLDGKPLETIFDLYKPGDFVNNIDAYSGATVRANKVLSSIRDGLNRGTYTPAGEANREIGTYKDGRYRGIFNDGGTQQVSIQFDLQNNTIKNLSFRHLFYGGVDYRQLKEGNEKYPVLLQNQQILKYLDGKPLVSIFDLHKPGNFVDNIDAYSGATVRANKVLSSIRDGLNRGVYTLTATATPGPTTPDDVTGATDEPSVPPTTTPVPPTTTPDPTTPTPPEPPTTTPDSTTPPTVISDTTVTPEKNLPKTGQVPTVAFIVSGLAASITGIKLLRRNKKS